MSGELNFEAMPFEAYDGFRTAEAASSWRKNSAAGRGSRGVSARAPRVIPSRSTRAIGFAVPRTKETPGSPAAFPAIPGGLGVRPSSLMEPPSRAYPAEPLPAGSEYMRWVQSALNDVLGLRLPVNGIGGFGDTQRHSQLSAA